ncbi:MAG: double-cubane-cluster-containing anaerobic reductase [Planctomycetota bacterium]|jgi:benzoyl-CoA reductase/2-hydroxyglutaryl-CoA dehydratase subunit BcrC/BadD/HgdB
MSEDYTQMWTDLGLDLKAHDALLEVLGNFYQNIFLAQKNRPEGMQYFDFVMSEVHGLRIREIMDAKEQGRKVIGSFCVFVPEELILAVDGVSIGLCAGADFATEEVDKILPRNTCALIKSAFGFKLGKVCPYVEAADLVVGENTCDGKKKSYELYSQLVPDFFAMDMPQVKSQEGKVLLRAEYKRFAEKLEQLSGKKITVENLKKGIATANAKRSVIHRLASLRKADPAPVSGLDSLLANQVFFYDNPERFTESVAKICDEVEDRVGKRAGVFDKGTPRIVISGCPMAVPNWKVPWIIETSGAVIVGEESCIGERGARNLTGEKGDSVDSLIDNIVDRYFEIDCAIFTPNTTRLEHIKEIVKNTNADGVIHYCLNFCQPYQMESDVTVKELEKAGIPAFNLDTDYSMEDVDQLKVRVEAFIERLQK